VQPEGGWLDHEIDKSIERLRGLMKVDPDNIVRANHLDALVDLRDARKRIAELERERDEAFKTRDLVSGAMTDNSNAYMQERDAALARCAMLQEALLALHKWNNSLAFVGIPDSWRLADAALAATDADVADWLKARDERVRSEERERDMLPSTHRARGKERSGE